MQKEDYGILNFLAIKSDEVLTGNYYARLPETPNDIADEFQYDIVNEHDKAYSLVLNNLQTDRTTCVIKTNDNCGFKINGYVTTQDGILWQITSIGKQLVKAETKQALRWLKQTIETEYVLRLLEVDNPWDLQ